MPSDLLNVTAAPNNGTSGALNHLLKEQPGAPAADSGKEYGDCAFPASDEEYEIRVNSSDCLCNLQVGHQEYSP